MTKERRAEIRLMKVGDTLYRVSFHGEIYNFKIIDETSRSWLVGNSWRPDKVPKRGNPDWFLDFPAAVNESRRRKYRSASWRIGDAVRHCPDPDKLKEIADIVGFIPEGL